MYCKLMSFIQILVLMVGYNVQKELFPCLKGILSLGKIPMLFPSKITENSIRNVIEENNEICIICVVG